MIRILFFIAFWATALAASLPSGAKLPSLSARTPSAGKIVGGTETTIENHPYQVALLRSGYLICGGSIIRANAVLTAGHCTTGAASYFGVRAGSSTHESGGTIIGASAIRVHEQYDSRELDYDLSFVTLESNLPLEPTIAIIALPTQGQTVGDGLIATTTGWGSTYEGGNIVSILRELQIPTVNQAQCATAYATYGWWISNRMICVGSFLGGQDACQGDSGGPLVIDEELIGITSWGWGCARPGFPGVWTRIPVLVDWINEN